MSKFVLWGGFGGLNLGDDLILVSTIRDLERFDIDGCVFLMGSDWSFIQNSIRVDFRLVEDSFLNRFNSYREGYCLVVPGGQVIDDECKYFPYGKLTLDVLLSRLFTKQYPYILSVGVRNVSSKLHKMYAWIHRSSIQKIIARDAVSQSNVEKIYGKHKSTIMLDPVVANESLWLRRDHVNPDANTGKALLVMGVEKARHDSCSMLALAGRFCKLRLQGALSVMQHDRRFDQDTASIRKSDKDLDLCEVGWPTGLDELLSAYRAHLYVFTNRLHVALVGLINGCLVHLDSNTPKLESIKCMGFSLASYEVDGLTFHYLDENGWRQLQDAVEQREEVLKSLFK
ncbi:MAG: polysaccharide pyruvyl transferase family protein [Verrucomicrobiae bacterium]|nr:polysaccharide pyruvyl transferase family protein [Verrucomicrobiae bacterium]NNJ42524.1 polysaccharide pyruvyl transferase family protein [Akkermansiaceae bacterium]